MFDHVYIESTDNVYKQCELVERVPGTKYSNYIMHIVLSEMNPKNRNGIQKWRSAPIKSDKIARKWFRHILKNRITLNECCACACTRDHYLSLDFGIALQDSGKGNANRSHAPHSTRIAKCNLLRIKLWSKIKSLLALWCICFQCGDDQAMHSIIFIFFPQQSIEFHWSFYFDCYSCSESIRVECT